MTTTESLFAETINDFCNKIGTKRRKTNITRKSAVGGEADMRTVDPSIQSDANDPYATWPSLERDQRTQVLGLLAR
jgi:hypothetical protein